MLINTITPLWRINYITYMFNDDDFTTEVNASLLDTDFDEVAWEPEVVDDSDEEAAEEYGY